MKIFPEHQYNILNYLDKLNEAIELKHLSEILNTDPIFISGAAQTLAEMGYIEIKEERFKEYRLDENAIDALENGLSERRIIRFLIENKAPISISEIATKMKVDTKFIGENLKFLNMRSWIDNKKGMLYLKEKAIKEVSEEDVEIFLKALKDGPLNEAELIKRNIELDSIIKLIKPRKKFISIKERTRRFLSLTDKGRSLINSGIEVKKTITQLTSEMLLSSSWKGADFKKYDINISTERKVPGKQHPFIRVLNETRNVFLQMGFEEISSPMVESGFWDFDALFQPQDHPAREMQDTFYVSQPATSKLPNKDLVESVRKTHENGGDTGSKGWQYKWDINKARQNVLRTHTTATTVRAVNYLKKGPAKVFTVGRVFRRETIDFKHLPVFFQVDGIIIDKNASFSVLLGTLEAFYRKMGFDRFEFRPAFFPYTEPSVEIFVWHNDKKDWFEMGGAGVFRPEVTLPLGCSDTVLAWGLGMERLAMFRYDIHDIRDIYMSDIKWLESVSLK